MNKAKTLSAGIKNKLWNEYLSQKKIKNGIKSFDKFLKSKL